MSQRDFEQAARAVNDIDNAPRPMSEAPRDGARILAWTEHPYATDYCWSVMRWSEERNFWVNDAAGPALVYWPDRVVRAWLPLPSDYAPPPPAAEAPVPGIGGELALIRTQLHELRQMVVGLARNPTLDAAERAAVDTSGDLPEFLRPR